MNARARAPVVNGIVPGAAEPAVEPAAEPAVESDVESDAEQAAVSSARRWRWEPPSTNVHRERCGEPMRDVQHRR